MYNPHQIALDSSNNLYIADVPWYSILKVTRSTGIVTLFAGTWNSGFYTGGTLTSTNGVAATSMVFYFPQGIGLDSSDNLYVYDNTVIWKIPSTGSTSSIVAGTFGVYCTSVTGADCGDNGPALSAKINNGGSSIFGTFTFDTSDNVYFTDTLNSVVRFINVAVSCASDVYFLSLVCHDCDRVSTHPLAQTKIISVVAGTYRDRTLGGFSGNGGPATSAALYFPGGVYYDKVCEGCLDPCALLR
jgi:hypothetical protein